VPAQSIVADRTEHSKVADRRFDETLDAAYNEGVVETVGQQNQHLRRYVTHQDADLALKQGKRL